MEVLVDPDFRDLQFSKRTRSRFFVDKTELLGEIFAAIDEDEVYKCVTRPRRFGKSIAASMIASFFGPKDSSELFDRMLIAQHPDYHQFLNAFHVIYLDLIPNDRTAGVAGLLAGLKAALQAQLKNVFPGVFASIEGDVIQFLSDIYTQTGAKFVFVIDEWDSILHDEGLSEADRKTYLSFFTALLKGKRYVAFAYLTGILPISVHSSGSDLNMFRDYTFISDETFDRFFGFTEAEVDRLFEVYQDSCAKPRITRDELDLWYNGYSSKTGIRLYNPQSVCFALSANQVGDYWGDSGPNGELFEMVRFNVDAVLADIEDLLADKPVTVQVAAKLATERKFETREQILSALVVYGLLTIGFDEQLGNIVRIPNEEVRRKFVDNIRRFADFGRLHQIAVASGELLDALLRFETGRVAAAVQLVHTVVSPVRDYNRELELAHVLDWAFAGIDSLYDKQREVEAGNGFADFVLVPAGLNSKLPVFIIELKLGASPQVAIEQIKSRNYAQSFVEMPRLKGKIVAVGISYDPADPSKTHQCEIEVLREAV